MDWSRLLAGSATGRRAIYDERFPSRWDELEADLGAIDFTEHEAGQLLTVFASHWEYLPVAADRDDVRYHVVVVRLLDSADQIGVALFARALRDDQLVVAYPLLVRRL